MNSFTFPVQTDHMPGGWHAAYMEVYERLFSPFKETYVRLLEIGTDGGGGLRAYKEYFKDSGVWGVDINPPPQSIIGELGITHLQEDAYTPKFFSFLKSVLAFDIAIEDGPHTFSSQEFFVRNYPNLLTDRGIAIVEDIQEYAHAQYLAALVPDGFFSAIVDLRHVNGRYDDLLLTIWRK